MLRATSRRRRSSRVTRSVTSTSMSPRCGPNRASCTCSTSKFAFVELHEKATTAVSREFLLRLIAAVPYTIHTVLTDNGIQFTTPGGGGSAVPLIKEAIANGERLWAHAFELACARDDSAKRTSTAWPPATNGPV